MELKDPIQEARRYLSNAKEILRTKAGKQDGMYSDSKYVKMAGHTMWTGTLIALDYGLGIKWKKDERPDIDRYKMEAAKVDKKLSTKIQAGYHVMHLSLGYDGCKLATIAKSGEELMLDIIDWCENRRKVVGR